MTNKFDPRELPPLDHEAFAASFEAMANRCRDVLITKAGEYADNGDRLQNFTQGAALTGETPEQVLAGYMLKHTLSVYKMLGDDEWYHLEKWYEKIGDHMNYLFLLIAMIEHRKETADRAASREVNSLFSGGPEANRRQFVPEN